MQVRGVIFDCDGTLLDSMGAWREVESDLARRAGVVLSEEEVELLGANTLPQTARYFHELYEIGFTTEAVEKEMEEGLYRYYRDQVEPREGVLDFVGALAEVGVKMSVASSSPRYLLETGLVRVGLLSFMDTVVSVSDTGVSKREPVTIDRARESMGTERCFTWGFEDSLYAIEVLKRAGYHAIGVHDRDEAGSLADLKRAADHAVDEFGDLDVSLFLKGGYAKKV